MFLLALLSGAPAVLAATWFGVTAPLSALARWTVVGAVALCWLAGAALLRERVSRTLQTLSNMLGAMREGDYSMRPRPMDPRSPLGLAVWEVNSLADALRRERLDAMEATALLRQLTEAMDVAAFVFDEDGRLRWLNRHGERMLDMPSERSLGAEAAQLGLGETLIGGTPRLLRLDLPGVRGRWELRRGAYRQGGKPHRLVALTDLSRALREEEREAWWRLIRVLSHEINNSLAPIQSLAGSMQRVLERADAGAARADLREGLGVIEGRAQSLGRFLRGYADFARLPKPAERPLDVGAWVRRVAGLETRLAVEVVPGPPCTVTADGDQLDQLLINLVRNAVDATLESKGAVRVGWRVVGDHLVVEVVDEGTGLADTENLFVPFFTTKPEGTGVGLALSRQIAESHGGTLTLENRADARGCVARLTLPLIRRAAPAT